jgi:hypothetical protein
MPLYRSVKTLMIVGIVATFAITDRAWMQDQRRFIVAVRMDGRVSSAKTPFSPVKVLAMHANMAYVKMRYKYLRELRRLIRAPATKVGKEMLVT